MLALEIHTRVIVFFIIIKGDNLVQIPLPLYSLLSNRLGIVSSLAFEQDLITSKKQLSFLLPKA